jgi:hypothetical protein
MSSVFGAGILCSKKAKRLSEKAASFFGAEWGNRV